jgi:hypothetical protein
VTRADEIGIRKIDKSKYPAKEDIKPKDESVELDELHKPENESQEQDMQEIVDELNLGKSASMVH